MKSLNSTLEGVRTSDIVEMRNLLMANPSSLRLESGEPDFPVHEEIKSAIIRALIENRTRYTNSSGIPELRQAIYEKCVRENRIPLNSKEDVIVTNGGVGAIYSTLKVIINSGEGDEIIIHDPNWTPAAEMIKINHGVPVYAPLDAKNGFKLLPDEIRKRVTGKTKAIMVNSPHNPTGAVFTRRDLEEVVQIAEENDLYLLSDEAYEHIVYDAEHVSLGAISKPGRTISMHTGSKSYNMPGLRFGYIATTNEQVMRNLRKVVLYSCNGVNSITQDGGIAALSKTDVRADFEGIVAEYRKRRDILLEAVNSSRHFECQTPQGAFYLFPRIKDTNLSDSGVVAKLLNNDPPLGSIKGSSFGKCGEGYIRLAYSTSTEDVKRAGEILAGLKLN
ncbi:pyridoxal phosphate-dependent aminotransferase [Candidatus Pacearchaeota archaeon]|nr:pyridoxal phosphate-dependent aminotransferase [Candidatus Pacearchaeota archaeon]